MNNFFIRFGKPLFAFTTIIILVFQGYWLWNTYQNEKKAFLDHIKIEVQEILVRKMIYNMYSNPKTSALFNSKDTNYDRVQIPNPYKVNEKIDVLFEKTKNKQSSIKEGSEELYIKSKNIDSLIYYLVKSSTSELSKNGDITIYHEKEKSFRTYPLGQKINSKYTTDPINSLLKGEGTYRVHIEKLPAIIIHKILSSIIFSLLYIILFFSTMVLLFRNLMLNQKLLKNKEIFTQNMTHELKIPISTILIAAEGLEKYNIINEPEGVKKYARTIQRSTHQLSFLVESILKHARADHNNQKPETASISLLALLEEVKETLSDIIANKQADIIFEDISGKITVKGNYEQLRQVFLNLLDNSLKYSIEKPVIIISAHQVLKNIIIKIKDNGIGIPEKYATEVFDPYFRIPNGDLHDVKGFGLGLSFVKKALKNQGGSIRVHKTEKEGTTMEIKIPSYES